MPELEESIGIHFLNQTRHDRNEMNPADRPAIGRFLLWSAQGITGQAGNYFFRTAPKASEKWISQKEPGMKENSRTVYLTGRGSLPMPTVADMKVNMHNETLSPWLDVSPCSLSEVSRCSLSAAGSFNSKEAKKLEKRLTFFPMVTNRLEPTKWISSSRRNNQRHG